MDNVELDMLVSYNLKRGRIIQINGSTVELYLLDSGKTEEAVLTSLYHLPDLARDYPPLAYPCKLRYILFSVD